MLDNTEIRNRSLFNRGGLREEDLARADRHVREALIENKRSGLTLAVRARWVALAITAVLLVYLNPRWEVLYYEVALGGFALIGWAQLRAGKVAQSPRELGLILADLVLFTFIAVVPNPFRSEDWPTAFQYQMAEFGYFYVLLALATLAYSWRTLVAFGTWTTALWLLALFLVAKFGVQVTELTANAQTAFAGYNQIAAFFDPNNPNIPVRVQEIVIFLIVTGILVINGRRTNRLMFSQAAAARERANLARYFPPNLVDQMAGRDHPLAAVRSQHVATMFVDIVGFTRMAEQQTPEEVVAMLRQFHGRLEAAVFDHNGTLDKFLGDGLMATFGTPETSDADASNALRCSRAMISDIAAWNVERRRAGADPVQISIGIHYGPVILGDIGSERRLEYAVLGDAVNVASRLEALTRSLGVTLIVSEQLVSAVRREGTQCAALDGLDNAGPQQLRGRDNPIDIWTFDGGLDATPAVDL